MSIGLEHIHKKKKAKKSVSPSASPTLPLPTVNKSPLRPWQSYDMIEGPGRPLKTRKIVQQLYLKEQLFLEHHSPHNEEKIPPQKNLSQHHHSLYSGVQHSQKVSSTISESSSLHVMPLARPVGTWSFFKFLWKSLITRS
jgi:hypothetical protein